MSRPFKRGNILRASRMYGNNSGMGYSLGMRSSQLSAGNAANKFHQAFRLGNVSLASVPFLSSQPSSRDTDTDSTFFFGTIDRFDQKLESAEAKSVQAQNLWVTGGQLRIDPFATACMYKMGLVARDQGKLEAEV